MKSPAPLMTLLLACLAAGATHAQRFERGALIYDGIPEARPEDTGRLQDYLETRSGRLAGWTADGSLLVATRFGNTVQLHRVRAPLGMREQLTFQSEPVGSAAPHPFDAESLIYQMDAGGNENLQLHLLDLKSGQARLLTDGKSLYGRPVWARDGKRVAYSGNARTGIDYDIYVADTTSKEPARLVMAGGRDEWSVQDWSLDDHQLLVRRYTSITDSALFLVNVDTGTKTQLVPGPKDKGTQSVRQGRFASDGRSVIYTSDNGGEHVELRQVDLFGGSNSVLAPQSRWDVEGLELSTGGRYLAYLINEGGTSRLVVHDLVQKADLLLPALPAGAVIGNLKFDRQGVRLALEIETAQSPADVYVLTLGQAAPAGEAAPTLARWTQSELGPIDRSALVPAELVEFPTWDSDSGQPRRIPAFVYRPRTPGPHPVVIDIHGGPESQYRPTYSAFTQYLVNELGYTVVAPNVRGSSGYGRTFLGLDDGELREDSVRDIGSLLVWIGLQPQMDRNRVVAYGASYGGYMVLASMVNYGDRLAGGIDVVGISDFVTFLTNTSVNRQELRRAEYGDERKSDIREFLKRISPLTNASAIRKPLLMVVGLNDPRVPASESEQLLYRLRATGTEAWYLAAKDEGHGFRKKANRDAQVATMVQFLRKLK